jgi:hypothetical protein
MFWSKKFSKLLNSRPFWNVVTFKIFWNDLRISWIPTCKLSIALWVPPCPMLCTTELIWLDFNYLCVPMTWCHVAHLFPSNNVRSDVDFFYFFILWMTCQQLHILFYDKSQISFRKITKNMTNHLFINKILLHRRSRARPINATKPGGPVRMGYVVRLSHATLSDVTESSHSIWHDWGRTSLASRTHGVTGSHAIGSSVTPEMTAVTPDKVAWLSQCPQCLVHSGPNRP